MTTNHLRAAPVSQGRTEMANEDDDRDVFTVEVQDFQGPLNRLVEEVERKRIDIASVPLLFIVEQFLDWFRQAMDARLEVAADWLLAAAKLAALKARLLAVPGSGERTRILFAGEDVRLTTARKEALRTIVEELQRRRRLGVNWFAPGVEQEENPGKRLEASLHGLLLAYVREARRTLVPAAAPVRKPFLVMSIDDAQRSVARRCEEGLDWTDVLDLLPPDPASNDIHARSRIAATYVACLQLAKAGIAEVTQVERGTIMVRSLDEVRP